MKFLLVSTLVFCVLSGPSLRASDSDLVMPQELIDMINESQNDWTASSNWVGQMTMADVRKYVSTELRPRVWPEFDWGAILDNLQVPDNFDSRTQWPDCVHPIRDQGQCGSCWAFAATEALSDRLCISAGIDVVLSPQYLVSCDSTSFGCDGGYPDLAWTFMSTNGVPDDSCDPYSATNGVCSKTCADGSEIEFFHAKTVSTYSGPTSIQAAILAGGPVETGFRVYQDFMSYSGGIYKHKTGKYLGGHAVKIIGWGVESGTKYWICANSWGTSWGINGFFNIAFGQVGIDSQAVAGTV